MAPERQGDPEPKWRPKQGPKQGRKQGPARGSKLSRGQGEVQGWEARRQAAGALESADGDKRPGNSDLPHQALDAADVPGVRAAAGPEAKTHGGEMSGMTGVAADDWDDDEREIIPLTRAEAEGLFGPSVSRPSRVTPFRVVGAQFALTVIAALLSWLLTGSREAAWSAGVGGAACWIPSAWFAWRLRAATRNAALTWAVAELVKIMATLAILGAGVAWLGHGVWWLPLLVTFVLALKIYWLALAWR